MFVRGVDDSQEYNRVDQSFYKGIVVKNNDPNHLHRVKVYIPELSNQPIAEWLLKYKNFSVKFPGKNNEHDSWNEVGEFEKIAKLLPWAEPCFPVLGESGPGRYQSPEEKAIVNGSNYKEAFVDGDRIPSFQSGYFAASYLYERRDTCLGDRFISSQFTGKNTYTNNINPYSYEARPSNHVNKSSGSFSVPSVGSKVWIFHYGGDINFPVYFGVRQDFRDTSLINNLDQNDAGTSDLHDMVNLDYPTLFENAAKTETQLNE